MVAFQVPEKQTGKLVTLNEIMNEIPTI